MSRSGSNKPISYREFEQRVRRHSRTEVLIAVAEANATLEIAEMKDPRLARMAPMRPFMLGGIAHAALTSGNEFRDKPVTRNVLRALCSDYVNVYDPALSETGHESRVRSLLSRIAYEQFGGQYSIMENIGRTVVLFEDHAAAAAGDAPSPEEWREILGAFLDQYIRIAFIMTVAALNNNGRIGKDVLRAEHVAPIFHPLNPDTAIRVIDNRFSASLDQLRDQARLAQVRGFEKWSLNPLVTRPVVALPDDTYVMPWPRLILDMATPANMYYLGVERYGNQFARSVGRMFEAYVGAQLGQLEHATVVPELSYGRGNGARTVDHFIVTDEVVVLVEVKAARPVWSVRLGSADGDDDIVKKVGRAFRQIENTASLLRQQTDIFPELPRDRPVCGLVITLEPFHLLNTPFFDDLLTRPTVPTAVASAHELESTVAALAEREDIGKRLLKALSATNRDAAILTRAADDLPRRKNVLLDAAWTRFMSPMSDVFEQFGIESENF